MTECNTAIVLFQILWYSPFHWIVCFKQLCERVRVLVECVIALHTDMLLKASSCNTYACIFQLARDIENEVTNKVKKQDIKELVTNHTRQVVEQFSRDLLKFR